MITTPPAILPPPKPQLDPTGKTDSTPAFQQAIDAANGGTVQIPVGTFAFTTLRIARPMRFIGSGPGTVLTKTMGVAGIFVLADNVTLADFTLDSRATGVSDGIVVGAPDATHVAGNVLLDSLQILHQGGDGVRVVNGNCGEMRRVTVTACQGHGICLDSQATNCWNVNCWKLDVMCYGNIGDGLHLGKAVSNFITRVISEGNNGVGIFCDCDYNQICGYVEGNVGGPGHFTPAARFNVGTIRVVAGAILIDNPTTKITVLGSNS